MIANVGIVASEVHEQADLGRATVHLIHQLIVPLSRETSQRGRERVVRHEENIH